MINSTIDLDNLKNNKLIMSRRFKKVLLILPFIFSVLFITSCGIPKIKYDTNVKYSNILNIISSIQKVLVNDNPDKSATKYNDFMQGDPKDPSTKSILLSLQFCSDYENTQYDNLKSITYPKKNFYNKYTYYWNKIIGLYVNPVEVDESFLKPTTSDMWAKNFPAPTAPYDHKDLEDFDYGKIWNSLIGTSIYSGVLEVKGANEFKPGITQNIVYIRFLLLFDKVSTPNAIDIFLGSPDSWVEK